MRILHVSWEYPPLVYGGLGRHVPALATAQAAAGHDVWVVTQRTQGAPDDEIVQGVRVLRRADTPDLEFIPENLLGWVAALDRQLAAGALEALAGLPPDVVHCHDWMTTTAGTVLTRTAGIPLVATIHATERGRHQGHLPGDISHQVDAVERSLCRAANVVITCSEAMRREVTSSFGIPDSKVAVIPNGIAAEDWQSSTAERAQARMRWAKGGPLLVFVGRLEVEKGILVLAEAMAKVVSHSPAATLVLAGKGSQTERLERTCREAGITDHVQLAGWLPEAELRALIGSADAAVIPSLYEPFGLVALEAMALGTPVIASHIGGLAEFVRDGDTGWSVPANDPDALGAALLEAISDPARAQAQVERASTALAVDFDWSRIAAVTVEQYQRAIANAAEKWSF